MIYSYLDAKAEARGALHETGSDAQQEYGYDKATHKNFPNTSITFIHTVTKLLIILKSQNSEHQHACMIGWVVTRFNYC